MSISVYFLRGFSKAAKDNVFPPKAGKWIQSLRLCFILEQVREKKKASW